MLDKVWDKTALIVSSCKWARNMAYPERKKVEKSKKHTWPAYYGPWSCVSISNDLFKGTQVIE
jgi:hypothetical protein